MSEQTGEVDFALAAFRDDGTWQVQEIAAPAFDSVDSLSHALRQVARDDGAVGMVAVDEDFFVIVRVSGPSTRVLLSDVTAADEWELAQSVIDFLGLPPPEDDDVELYPDEMLSEIARRLGFGELFDDAVGLTSA